MITAMFRASTIATITLLGGLAAGCATTGDNHLSKIAQQARANQAQMEIKSEVTSETEDALKLEASKLFTELTELMNQAGGMGVKQEAANAALHQAINAYNGGQTSDALVILRSATSTLRANMAPMWQSMATIEVNLAKGTANKDREQYQQQQIAESLLRVGDYENAYNVASKLNNAMKESTVTLTARTSKLSDIAKLEDVYGSEQWWPIIYKDNYRRAPNPDNVKNGTQIEIRLNPATKEVATAARYATYRKNLSPDIQRAADEAFLGTKLPNEANVIPILSRKSEKPATPAIKPRVTTAAKKSTVITPRKLETRKATNSVIASNGGNVIPISPRLMK